MPQPYAPNTAINAAGLLLFMSVIVLVPSLQWLSPNTEDHENRRLAKFPGFPGTLAELGEFPAGFSAYMDDNFGLRGTLLRWYNLLLLELGASRDQQAQGGEGHQTGELSNAKHDWNLRGDCRRGGGRHRGPISVAQGPESSGGVGPSECGDLVEGQHDDQHRDRQQAADQESFHRLPDAA